MKSHGGMTVVAFAHFAVCHDADSQGLDTEILGEAIRNLQKEFLLLQAAIRKIRGKFEFYLPDDMELPLARLTLEGPGTFESHVSACLSMDFSEAPLLWRLDVISYETGDRDGSLLLTIDHAIADATAACHFLDLVMQRYQEILSGKHTSRPAATGFPLPLETLVAHRLKPKEMGRFLLQEASKLLFPASQPAFDGTATAQERTTCSLHQSLSRKETRALVELVHQQGTTVNAMINAVLFFAFFKSMARDRIASDKAHAFPRSRISVVNNVGFRKSLGIEAHVPGVFISAVYNRFSLSPEVEFWALAKTAREAIQQEIEDNTPIISARLFPWLQGMLPDASHSALLNGPKQGRLESLCVSNIGRLEIGGRYGDIQWTDMGFCSAQHGFGHGFALSLLTFDDQLSLNLQYVQPLISKARAVALLEDMTALLRQLPSCATLTLQDYGLALRQT